MTFEEMKAKAEAFFEWPSEVHDTVTLTSTVIFAMRMYEKGIDAANTMPHRIMFDKGVEEGRRLALIKTSRHC